MPVSSKHRSQINACTKSASKKLMPGLVFIYLLSCNVEYVNGMLLSSQYKGCFQFYAQQLQLSEFGSSSLE